MLPGFNPRLAVCSVAAGLLLSTGVAATAGALLELASGLDGARSWAGGIDVRDRAAVRLVEAGPVPQPGSPTGEQANGPSGSSDAGARRDTAPTTAWRDQVEALRSRFFLDDGGLAGIDMFGVTPSPDASILFEAARRFFVDGIEQGRTMPRDLGSIRKFGAPVGWDRPFLLINLFRRNGIDAELVLYSFRDQFEPKDLLSFDSLDVPAVYVPVIDRYYDALELAPTQADFDRGLREVPRLHIAARSLRSLDTTGVCAGACVRLPDKPRPACRDRCAEPTQPIVRRRVKVLGFSTSGHPVRPIEDAAPGRFVKDRTWMPVP